MDSTADKSQREALIHLLRSGKTPREAAEEVGKSMAWSYKWRARYQREGWAGLQARSRAPHRVARHTPDHVRDAILGIRSELEAEAQKVETLSYIGSGAIRARLVVQRIKPIPSTATIERILHQAGATKPRSAPPKQEVVYPHLCPATTHQLTQVDIVPHYLKGGTSIACFNGIDVVSRYPAGQSYASKSSGEATDFLLHLWHELGISEYVQMDNEGCFSGGSKHAYVIGKVVRLALLVGVQPVFSPFYHPQSNAHVERFHQDYSAFVWKKGQMENLSGVRKRSALFFPTYRRSHHHSQLAGRSPQEIHLAHSVHKLPAGFRLPTKLPITEGQVHFMRAMDLDHNTLILNQKWTVACAQPAQGVWATLFLTHKGAKLRFYDSAPDALKRRCLADYPFPLQEPVVPLQPPFRSSAQKLSWQHILRSLFRRALPAPSTMS
jgi:hypothetical protein